jgi:hypothetical protein
MLGRFLAFVALAASFTPASFAQSGIGQGKGTVQGQGQIFVGPPTPPPTVSIQPTSQVMAVSTAQNFIATVTNDSFNQGVTWTLSGLGCSGATCGTLSTTTSKSGVAITYTAPGSAPTPNAIVLTATSILNPAGFTNANITITGTPPPVVVGNICGTLQFQTPAGTNTFICQPSNGSFIGVTINVSTTDTPTGVQACLPLPAGAPGACFNLIKACDPTNVCQGITTPGGISQIWYGIGLPIGLTQIVVTNSPAAGGVIDVSAIDSQNINAFGGAAASSSNDTATTNPVGPAITAVANSLTISTISTTGNASAVAAPFTFINLSGGDGAAYQLNSTDGTTTPNWTTTSGTWSGFTATFTGGTTTPVISVAMIPTSGSVKVNTTFAVTPTVTNDTAGVNLTLTGAGCSGATCGTLSSSTTASGVSVTYTAPAAVPSPATVTLTATSITDPTKTATTTITVTANPIVVTVSPGSSSVQTSATQTFSCTVTNDAAAAGCDWALSGAGCSGATCGGISVSHTASGVTLTYTGPAAVPSPATVSLTATSTTDNTKSAVATITVFAPPPIVVSVSPGSASVQTTQVQAFSCTLTNDAGAAGCDWALTGAGCSGATCGTLSVSHTASGVTLNYTAPASVPSPATVTLTATSTTDVTKSAAATITVTAPPAIIISVSPGSASVQTTNTKTFSCTLVNDGGAAGCDWALTGAGCSGATCGTLSVSHTASGVTLTYTAPGSVPSPATVTLTAASTTDPTKTAAATITVTAAPILTVSISPGTASVQTGLTQAFTPTVVNDGSNLGVDWTLTGAGCSGATCGTLSSAHTASGVATTYTAPSSVPGPATVTIHATSTTDNTKSATSTITVFAPAIVVSVSPGSASVRNGLTQAFTPTVTNDGTSAGVDWTLTGGGCSGATCGTLSSAHTASGVATTYTAPAVVPSPATVTIHATSTADNTKAATATITVFSLAISVSVAPGTATVPVNGTQAFTPTVTNDAANAGVDWTLGSCTTFSETFNEGSLPSNWIATNRTGVEGGGSFSPSHISLSQGVLQMNVTQDGTTAGSVGAEIQLNRQFGYGTYSWSMQAAGTSATQGGSGSAVSGQISSTFQYSGGNPVGTEIDAPEIEGQFPTQIEYTTWLNGVRSDFHQTTLANPQNTYHVYKYVWSPGQIIFSLDGTPVATTTLNVPTAPAYPLANLWGTNSTSFGGLATAGVTRYMYINSFTYSNCGTLSATHTASGAPVTYTAPANAPSPATVTITAASTTDNTKNASSTITIGTAPNITIAVAPTSASVTTNGVQNFTATLTNDTSNQGATWALTGAGCSGATCGTLSTAGSASGTPITYTAPNSAPSPATVTLTVKSVTDPTKTAAATITVTSPVVTVTVSPKTATFQAGSGSQLFTASVANSGATPAWTLSCTTNCGTITPASGFTTTYTPPASVASTITVTLTATVTGPVTGTATITVNPTAGPFSCVGKPCPAFAGSLGTAMGSAAPTPNGRGGVVYNITTTDDATHAGCVPFGSDSVTCSMRDCVQASGARNCIFRTDGMITQQTRLTIGNPFIYIAGQTAPGGGITLGGPTQNECLWASSHDILVRFLGYSGNNPAVNTGPQGGTGCFEVASGATDLIYLDHLSGYWYGNKAFAFNNNGGPTSTLKRVTYGWILVYEPICGDSLPETFPLFPGGPYTINCHPVGSLGTDATTGSALGTTDIDYHHNMIYTADHRLPFTQSANAVRWVNNISACWNQYAALVMGGMQVDWIGNKWKDCTVSTTYQGVVSGDLVHNFLYNVGNDPQDKSDNCIYGPCDNPGSLAGPPNAYMLNNTGRVGRTPVNNGGTQLTPTNVVNDSGEISMTSRGWEGGDTGDPNSNGPMPAAWFRSTPLPTEPFPIIPDPVTNIDNVVPPIVGASMHLNCDGTTSINRNAQDSRVINQYLNNQGGTLYNFQIANPAILKGTPCVESLHDGIADQWKQLYGLSTTDTNLYKTPDPVTGLTYLEDYLDGLRPGGGSVAPLLKTLTSAQKNVSQAGIDWTQTGLPSGPPDATWTQCGSTINASTFGNGSTDATFAINAAIAACSANTFALLGPGTFLFNSAAAGNPQLNISKSNVVLRGSGASSTILNSTGTNGTGSSNNAGWIVLGNDADPSVSNDVAITSGATAGSSSIVVASATNFAVGKLAVITELNDTSYVSAPPPSPTPGDSGGCTYCDMLWGGTRDRSQIVEITSVSGTTIGISPPLYTAYTLTPHALPFSATKNSGIENLQIVGNQTHSTTNNAQLTIYGCQYCWVKGVEFNYPDGDYLETYWTFRSDILNNYMTNGFNRSSGTNNLAIHVSGKTSASRVYNNIIERAVVALEYDIGAAGNVFAYNYATGDFNAPTNSNPPSFYSHSAHDQFNLLEGNIAGLNMFDVLHGSGSEQTSFRNWWQGTSFVCSPNNNPTTRGAVTCGSGFWAPSFTVGEFIGSLMPSVNMIGDVVGSAVQTGLGNIGAAVIKWNTTNVFSNSYGMSFGYSSAGDTGSSSFDSTNAFNTSFVHGLYNNVDGSTTWASGVTRSLPSSLYLSGKPSWWGSTPWPAIGPDITGGALPAGQGAGASPGGHVNTIPAMQCFYGTMGGVEGGAGSPRTFNPVTCYGN